MRDDDTVTRRCDVQFDQPRLARHAGRYRRYCGKACAAAARREARDGRALVLRRYDLTTEDYGRMLAAQGGRCAICGTTEPGTKPHRDRPRGSASTTTTAQSGSESCSAGRATPASDTSATTPSC
jgi:hypothetical protein